MYIEAEKTREFRVVDFADLPSFIVVDSKQETVPPLQEVDDRVIFSYRKETPAQKPVGHVPRQSAGCIRENDGIVNIEIQSSIGIGSRPGVTEEPVVFFSEMVFQRNLEGVVEVQSGVL